VRYQTFSPKTYNTYNVAILVPKLSEVEIAREYIDPCPELNYDDVIAYALHKPKKKTPAHEIREYLTEIIPYLEDLGIQYLFVGDGDYFKALTGVQKTDAYLGYVLPSTFPTVSGKTFQVIYLPNYRQVFYDPQKTRAKIKLGLDAYVEFHQGTYREPGCNIFTYSAYPTTVEEIKYHLDKIQNRPPMKGLAVDVETFSLKHYSAGIGTISIAWSETEGIAFPVDLGDNPTAVRALLRDFFEKNNKNLYFHNAAFDVCVLIYQLFMKDLLDMDGMLHGIHVFMGTVDEWGEGLTCHDTKLIAYLATNSCAGNELSLKALSQPYTGNYAVEEINDITKIPLDDLLRYNLVDAVATLWVANKYWSKMWKDKQYYVYSLFQKALIDIVQMQLCGMPLDMAKVKEAKTIFEEDRDLTRNIILNNKIVQNFQYLLEEEHVEERNATLKKKRIKMGDEPQEFNPNSPQQKQRLFYEVIGLPIIERTATNQPATGAEVLEKLKAYTEDQGIKDLIDAFLQYAAVDKLYSTFIPAMENAVEGPNGHFYLFGNFNLGGTVSGRLSSSDPNLQTIPSKNNKRGLRNYAKLIKDCFRAPKGRLIIGLDFSSLEDRISALTTQDPNKLKVYTDGYDGHCLRAYSYFSEQMPDIDPTSVASINSIEQKYPDLRQDSKGPTFALTYQGTFLTLIAKFGFSKVVAKQIEARYHELYKVSDDWVQERLQKATEDGYITAAFGLRVRTPLLHQVILGNSKTPNEAQAEARTAGNALGQSWCLLNTRASVEFMTRVRTSQYAKDIRPIAHIHDAQYYDIPDDIDVLTYVNRFLVDAVKWQKDPKIYHPQVGIEGELAVFHPSWAYPIPIPNDATRDQIFDIVANTLSNKKVA